MEQIDSTVVEACMTACIQKKAAFSKSYLFQYLLYRVVSLAFELDGRLKQKSSGEYQEHYGRYSRMSLDKLELALNGFGLEVHS